jgi:hypothetical protein
VPRSGQHRHPYHPRGRRPLRLLAAIGAAVGGLCLVLATLELVVQLGPRHPGTATPVASAIRGSGSDRPAKIHLPRRYMITWSFRCPPGKRGTFWLDSASASGPGRTEQRASGPRRSGTWRPRSDESARDLYVVSDCAWSARLIPPDETASPAPRATGRHGRRHRRHGDQHAQKKHRGHSKHKKQRHKRPKNTKHKHKKHKHKKHKH